MESETHSLYPLHDLVVGPVFTCTEDSASEYIVFLLILSPPIRLMASILNTLCGFMAWSGQDTAEHCIMYKRSASARVDAFNTSAQSLQSTPQLTRQRTVAFSMACCCLCAKNRLKDKDFRPSSSIKNNLLFQGRSSDPNLKEDAQRHQSWWQERWQLLGSRTKTRTWSQRDASNEEVHYRLPKWKQILRKLRAETRKMNGGRQSLARFNYDPLSYAMNFDDGCWQCDLHGQGYIHSMRFSPPMAVESDSFRSHVMKCAPVPQPNSMSVWQRRKACQPPPALDLKMVRVWRPAYINM